MTYSYQPILLKGGNNVFTGLIEEMGVVQSISNSHESIVLRIKSKRVLEDVKVGDSISTNGVCLTVVDFDNASFAVDVMPATFRLTNLKNLKTGSIVNLERAMKLGDRFGGHIVSGHVDGLGELTEYKSDGNATWLTIGVDNDLLKYVIKKGSVTLDGVSLTVAELGKTYFKVSLIPETVRSTTLLDKTIGTFINIECDIVGKYIERFCVWQPADSKSNVTESMLKENGFI